MIKTFGVAREFIAGKYPAVLLHARSKFGNLPILGESAVALHPQVSNLAVRDRCARFVNYSRFIAGNLATASSGTRLAGPRREKNVEHFRRTDTVQNFNSEALAKALENLRGQRFAGRDRYANRGEIYIEALFRITKKSSVKGGHGEKDGRAVLGYKLRDTIGTRAVGIKHGARAEKEREIHSIAKTIGEIELRNGEHAVIRAQGQDALREVTRSDQHVAVAMHGSFRRSTAAGGIEKKRGAGGGRRIGFCSFAIDGKPTVGMNDRARGILQARDGVAENHD